MSITSLQYARLANDAYTLRSAGIRAPGEREQVDIDGVRFEVLEHVENRRNGYAGTMYQRVDTGEIVVAHRGTNEVFRDGILADAGMVTLRSNVQTADALALVERAIARAQDIAERSGHAPEVTVTGHSLGGTLTQITAHHHGLRGETFNGYGAASLNRRIPEGGEAVTNHVMASDVVSAASPHYGQVRIYARPDEIQRLSRYRYDNGPGGLLDAMDRDAVRVAANSLGAHSMHHFTNQDADGRPDLAVMQNPAAQRLAADNAVMIGKYRGDVLAIRSGLSIGLGGPINNLREGIDRLRGPLEPGAPSRTGSEDWLRLPEGSGARLRSGDVERAKEMFLSPREWKWPASFESVPPSETELKESILRHLQQDFPGKLLDAPGKQSSLEQDPGAFIDRMLAAAHGGDKAGFRQLTQQAAGSEAGRQLRQEAVAQVDQYEQEQMRLVAAMQTQQEQEQQRMQGPRMRM